jgi:serine/threonine protein kinase
VTEPDVDDHRRIEEIFTRFLADCRAGLQPDVEASCAQVPEACQQQFREELLEVQQLYRPGETVPFVVGWKPAPLPTFDGYEDVREAGQGGMAVVYRAHQKSPDRIVALKVPKSTLAARERDRVRFEADASAALDHQHIVRIHAVGERDGQPFLCLQYVEGGSLADRLRERGYPLEKAIRLLAKVARAVHHAHQRGILHRDLKPANILLDRANEPHVTDFGLARRLGTPGSQWPDEVAGTAHRTWLRNKRAANPA